MATPAYTAINDEFTPRTRTLPRLEFDTDQQLLSAESDQTHATMADTARRLQLSLVADEFGSWSRDLATNRLDASGGCKALFGLPADAPFSHEVFNVTF